MATANASGHLHVPAQSKAPYDEETLASLRADAQRIIDRYPQSRSALLPMLHLVQSVDGYVTGRGIALCAEMLGLSTAEVSGVATFYTQFKRHPNGDYTVGVCTNTLCAIMGGDQIWDHISDYLGIGHDETTGDGKITLEKVECNAACDYAPVVMVNWEFYDNQTPQSTQQLVDDLRSGAEVRPSRGPNRQCTFKEVSRVLAGFHDGRADEGVGAGEASTLGLRIAKERGWTAPAGPAPAPIAEQLTPVEAPVQAPVDAPAEAAPSAPAASAAAASAPAASAAAASAPVAGAPAAAEPAQSPAAPQAVHAHGPGEEHSGADTPTDSAATTPRRRVVRRRSSGVLPEGVVTEAAAAAPASEPAAETPAETPAEPAAGPATLFDAAAGAGSAGAPARGAGVDGNDAAPFGPGTARPGPDGRGPDGWDIKGNADSMLFHTPQSPWYGRTKAEVWFRDEESAQAAGFTDARTRRRQSKDAGKDQA